MNPERCNWTQDRDDWWATDCGQHYGHEFFRSPADDGLTFCGYCGKKIAQASYQPETVSAVRG